MKKLISIMLVLCMALGMSVSVFADDHEHVWSYKNVEPGYHQKTCTVTGCDQKNIGEYCTGGCYAVSGKCPECKKNMTAGVDVWTHPNRDKDGHCDVCNATATEGQHEDRWGWDENTHWVYCTSDGETSTPVGHNWNTRGTSCRTCGAGADTTNAIEYGVEVDSGIVNGTVTAVPTYATAGETVTLTVTPDEGYELDVLTVTDASGADVTVTDDKFNMPTADVTVTATFKEKTAEPTPTPPTPPTPPTVIPTPEEDYVEDEGETLSVRIKFDGVDEDDIDTVKVNLLKNGKKYKSATINERDDWYQKWTNLDEGSKIEYTVELAKELEGFAAEVEHVRANYWTITLTSAEVEAPVVDKANPETGASDFVGAAVALAVVSSIGVVALNKRR